MNTERMPAPVKAGTPENTTTRKYLDFKDTLCGGAIALASAGMHVFPCRGKLPLTRNGFKDATVDPDIIRAWWQANPGANVAIATGASGLAVVDIDGAEGISTWQRLTAEWHTPRTLTAKTPSGGFHAYYRANTGHPLRSTVRQLGRGIDTRGVGGYVVAPPSRLPHGPYTWTHHPEVVPFIPAWILDALTPPERLAGPLPPAPRAGSRYAEKALHGEVQAVLDAAVGGRNHQLNRSAFALGQLVAASLLDENSVTAALEAAGAAIGLDSREAISTVRSGLTAGQAQPRAVRA